jgi:hypothetical protein
LEGFVDDGATLRRVLAGKGRDVEGGWVALDVVVFGNVPERGRVLDNGATVLVWVAVDGIAMGMFDRDIDLKGASENVTLSL